MKYTLGALALSAGASALAVERACTFTLTSSGGISGQVGQLADGQIRVGSNLPTAQTSFSIDNGQITNSAGSGCILTPPTTQFQCDVGATPTGGFAIGSNGVLTQNGSSTFYACPASDSQYNFYTTPVADQTKCVEVTLTASGCYAASSVASSMPVSTQTLTKTSTAYVSTCVNTPTVTITQSAAPVTVTETSTAQAVSMPAVTVTKTSTAQAASVPASTAYVTVVSQQTAYVSTCANTPTVTITQSAAPVTVTMTVVQQSAPQSAQPTVKSSSAAAATQKTTASAAASVPASSSSSCPADLAGNYQYPHLIIPVDSSKPTTAAGTSYNGVVSSTVSSIFNFDVPASYSGNTCSLVFLFPTQANLQTSSYTFSGAGSIDFSQLSTVATQSTTYANQGSVMTDFGSYTVTPGSSTVISTFACPAGQAVSYELKSVGGTALTYFQDYNPSPIGLYIRQC